MIVLNFVLFGIKITFYGKIYIGKGLVTKDIVKEI